MRPSSLVLMACVPLAAFGCGGQIASDGSSTAGASSPTDESGASQPAARPASSASTGWAMSAPVTLPAIPDPAADGSIPSVVGDDGSTSFVPPPPPLEAPPTPVVDEDGVCAPWSQVSGEAFVPVGLAGQTVAAALADLQNTMLGNWVGHVTSPWGEWDLTLTFMGDGHYRANASNGTGGSVAPDPLPFYYGSTDAACDPLDKWRLTALGADGAAMGEIDVPFGYGPSGCNLPGWQGELSAIDRNATRNRLQFAFNTSDGYGPIQYDLWRACGPVDAVPAGDD